MRVAISLDAHGWVGMSWALLGDALPLRTSSTRSFLESYSWITTKLPPAFLGKSWEGSRWDAAFQAWSDGSALPCSQQEIPVPAPCPRSAEPTLPGVAAL